MTVTDVIELIGEFRLRAGESPDTLRMSPATAMEIEGEARSAPGTAVSIWGVPVTLDQTVPFGIVKVSANRINPST